ncbi:MAG: septal ring lytic transglycosylase RlpA family protein, partial [Sphingomonadales bacterium]|nr:septal ring lytic transglycosylase RlpA family protein [Sphingomonadales bacterium]
TYTPSNPEHYDEVGYATFYGEGLAGRPTANGEAFRPDGVSAAHRTLPLPSYVEVTSLDNGETILVRVNDRGPFAENRIIDLSVGAARLLGIEDRGVAPVRVRRVQPPEADRARVRAGQAAPARFATSEQLLEALRARLADGGGIIPPATPPPEASGTVDAVSVPPPADRTSPPPSAATTAPLPRATGEYYVQLGAFSNAANARRLADRARSLGPVRIVDGGGLNRVRLGPFPDSRAAESTLARARQAGLTDARIFRDSSRP